MAHYQLSYGFNSSDTTTASVNNTNINTLQSKITSFQNIENQQEISLNVSKENIETEKRKLPQSSEPSNKYNLFSFCYDFL